MEEKSTQQAGPSEMFPHLKDGKDVLSAITNLCKDLYKPAESSTEEARASNALLNNLYEKARELGVREVEIATAALSGMPKNVQQDYFKELEADMIYGYKQDITPQDLLALRQKFGL